MNILYYGNHYWDRGPWFRKQYFAKYLTERGHCIFFIEGSTSIMKHNKQLKNKLFKFSFEKINDNLYIITPPAYFPFPNSYFSRHLFYLKLVHNIKKLFKSLKIDDYLIWFNIINFSSVLHLLNARKIIFDLSDDIPLYFKLSNNEKAYKVHSKCLKKAYQQADIPITTACKLKEKYQYLTDKEIIVISNGHNLDINSVHNKKFDIPADIKNIPRPVIGFIGTLFRFTDDELLDYCISSRPHYSFVFIGKHENGFPLSKIKKYHNVYILGEKPKNYIENYVNALDICFNPFKIHEVNDSVSPLKVFEYLALKKHVVSSCMYSLQKEDISKYIHFGKDYDEILNIIDSLVENRNYVNNIPDKELQKYHWYSLFMKLIGKINDNYDIEL